MRQEPVKEVKVGNKILRIFQDENSNNPRQDNENFCRLIFTGKHSGLGDKHNVKFEGGYDGRNGFIEQGEKEVRKQIKDVVICKPVHLYSHSGDSISTSYSYPYDCRWDSGTVGFAVVTKEDIRKNWGVKRVTQKLIDHADRILEAEVKTLDAYIRGDVYGFQLKEDENDIDSCWGFYGSDWKENGMTDHLDEEIAEALLAA